MPKFVADWLVILIEAAVIVFFYLVPRLTRLEKKISPDQISTFENWRGILVALAFLLLPAQILWFTSVSVKMLAGQILLYLQIVLVVIAAVATYFLMKKYGS
jgi:predicted transporter